MITPRRQLDGIAGTDVHHVTKLEEKNWGLCRLFLFFRYYDNYFLYSSSLNRTRSFFLVIKIILLLKDVMRLLLYWVNFLYVEFKKAF